MAGVAQSVSSPSDRSERQFWAALVREAAIPELGTVGTRPMNMFNAHAQRLLTGLFFAVAVASCTSSGESASSSETRIDSIATVTLALTTPPPTTDDPILADPALIECTLFYRSTLSTAEGNTETVSVKRTPDMLGDQATAVLGGFGFSVVYFGDVPEGENVLVSVGHPQDANGPSVQNLYTTEQAMTTSPYGFTGLHKMLVEGSELQWWCSST